MGQLKSWKWEANQVVGLNVTKCSQDNGFYQALFPEHSNRWFKSRSCFVLAPHRRFNNHDSVSPPLIHNLSHYCSLLFERPKSKSEIWKVDLPTVVKVRFYKHVVLKSTVTYIHTHTCRIISFIQKMSNFSFPLWSLYATARLHRSGFVIQVGT